MKMTPSRSKASLGFTLIELLVAMTILMIILVICAQIFQQARVAWSTGQDIVDMNMTGRAVADCIAQELAMAVDSNITISAASVSFLKLGAASPGTNALQQVTYDFTGGYVKRNNVNICPAASQAGSRPGVISLAFFPTATTLPAYVNITASVGVDGSATTNQYQTRVYFPNRKRCVLP